MKPSEITIEPLIPPHIAQAHELSSAVKWPHRPEDWQFLLGLGRGLAAVEGDRLAGTIIWWPFGESFATLGMVIVSTSFQGRGLGRRLMEAVLDRAAGRTILLNATRDGLPLYEKLGFKPIGAVHQHQAANATPDSARLPEGTRVRAMTPADIERVAALDEQAAGFGRREMLTALQGVGTGLILERHGDIAGWAFFRRFGRGYLIGPVGAVGEQSAKALISTFIASHGPEFLRIDVPASSGLSPWLEERGLPQVGGVVTMALGNEPPVPMTPGPKAFALSNQALG